MLAEGQTTTQIMFGISRIVLHIEPDHVLTTLAIYAAVYLNYMCMFGLSAKFIRSSQFLFNNCILRISSKCLCSSATVIKNATGAETFPTS